MDCSGYPSAIPTAEKPPMDAPLLNIPADSLLIVDVPIRREEAVSRYYALTTDHIIKVIDSIEAAPYEIKHLDSYVRKALFNAVHDIRVPE